MSKKEPQVGLNFKMVVFLKAKISVRELGVNRDVQKQPKLFGIFGHECGLLQEIIGVMS
jgi:hypothetical protein